MLNPQALLVLSRALRSLGTPLIAFMVMQVPELGDGAKDPVSFCNVLFLGNLCAALVVLSRYGPRAIWGDLRQLDRRVHVNLLLNGSLSVLVSSLVFQALSDTTVTNIILLGRLGPVLYALLGSWLFQQKITKAEWLGFSLIGIGVIAITFLNNDFQVKQGDLLVLASTVAFALSTSVSKKLLKQQASLKAIVFARNLIASVVFFAIALQFFGPRHFSDLFSGRLWLIMSVYALVVVVLSQFAWFAALKKLNSTVVARWMVLSPIFGVFYAFVLNGERPSVVQGVAFGVIMTGLVISSSGKLILKGLSENVEDGLSAS